MFTSPSPTPLPASALSSTTTTSSPPPRPSARLRGGLSFLRNYTHIHPLQSASREPESAASSPARHSKTSPRPRAASASASTTLSTPPISPLAAASASASTATHQHQQHQPQPQHHHRPLLTRTHTAPHSPSATPTSLPSPSGPVSADPPLPPSTMTRFRAESATPQLTVRNHSGPTPATASSSPPSSSMHPTAHDDRGDNPNKNLPSIRFIPHTDPRAARPSLQFATITRTLPDESAVIRVGRYSERDNIQEPPANVPSAAAVGFKSKVVSRKHCELWCKDGSWFIKDVKSSSGTFLNHIRLSQPNVESKPFRLKDGDIIQLGIDFRGGEEAIFRCVKIRIECNRGWQQALNTFNKQTHQRLRNLGKAKKDGDNASTHTSECSICLMSIAPCQSLFVAPCSHVWHYKCIRPILNGSTWPNFLCPNCRAVADLEADVEDMGEFETWDDEAAGSDSKSSDPEAQDRQVTPKSSTHLALANGNATSTSAQSSSDSGVSDLEAAISSVQLSDSANGVIPISSAVPSTPQPLQSRNTSTPAAASSVTQPVSINVQSANEAGLSPLYHHTTNGLQADRGAECPMTPRNDAGPFVLDGSGSLGRSAGQSSLRERDSAEAASGTTMGITTTGPDSAPLLPPINVD